MFDEPAILFVDRTNTWGSPIADAVFQFHTQRLGLPIRSSSAGLSRECAGDPLSDRVAAFAQRQGVDLRLHRARQFRLQDARTFSHIVALDLESFATFRAMRPRALSLLDDHADGCLSDLICDPFSGEPLDLPAAWDVISSGARSLAVEIAARMRRLPGAIDSEGLVTRA